MLKKLKKNQQIRFYNVVAITIIMLLYFFWQHWFINKGKYKRDDFAGDISKRFIKISKTGERIPMWSGPWNCVWDQANKIYWEVKTDDETIHDGYWSFSWMVDGEGVGNMGDCYILNRRCDTQDLIDINNVEKHCGRKSWRLPTVDEIQSLLYRPEIQGVIKVNSALFPNIKRGDYWTIDNSLYTASAFNFLHNHTIELPKANAAFAILVSE